MTSIIGPLVGILGAAAVSALPVFLVTERRRLLKTIREEHDTLALLTDPVAKKSVRRALRASTRTYAAIATESRSQRLGRQGMVVIALGAGLSGAGLLVLGLRALGIFEDEETFLGAPAVGGLWWLITAGVVLISIQIVRQVMAHARERQHGP